jgi:hypothetical protein
MPPNNPTPPLFGGSGISRRTACLALMIARLRAAGRLAQSAAPGASAHQEPADQGAPAPCSAAADRGSLHWSHLRAAAQPLPVMLLEVPWRRVHQGVQQNAAQGDLQEDVMPPCPNAEKCLNSSRTTGSSRGVHRIRFRESSSWAFPFWRSLLLRSCRRCSLPPADGIWQLASPERGGGKTSAVHWGKPCFRGYNFISQRMPSETLRADFAWRGQAASRSVTREVFLRCTGTTATRCALRSSSSS